MNAFTTASLRRLKALTALLLAASAICVVNTLTAKQKHSSVSIPDVARIGRVRIGYSTQEDLARVWGEGKTITGGHPNSGRLWRVRGTNLAISTDGFEYAGRGLIIDTFTIFDLSNPPAGKCGCQESFAELPYARLTKSDFSWLEKIVVGSPRETVLSVLHQKHLPVEIKSDASLTVSETGHYELTSIPEFLTRWEGRLSFTNGALCELSLSATATPSLARDH